MSAIACVLGIVVLPIGSHHASKVWNLWSIGMALLTCLKYTATLGTLACNIADLCLHQFTELSKAQSQSLLL